MQRRHVAALLALALAPLTAAGARADTLQTSALSHLVGEWVAQGPLLGRPVCNHARALWVIDGHYLELLLDSRTPGHPYQAAIFLGMDGAALSAHWLDVYGAGAAKVLGSGRLEPDGASLDFPYAGGALHDRLTYDPHADRWHWLIQGGTPAHPEPFADWSLTRGPGAACHPA